MAVEAPEIRTAPEQAWDELYGIIKKLPKPDPEATPPVTLDGIRRAALREWMASSNPDMGGGQAERGEAGADRRGGTEEGYGDAVENGPHASGSLDRVCADQEFGVDRYAGAGV